MSKVDLHIVAFNVPFPADYGGVIDVFYKLKFLSELGIKVALHCFDYGRGQKEELNELAAEVYYYTREVNKFQAVFLSPFSVKSRNSKQLLERLSADDAPILFESLQSCLYLDHLTLAHKSKWVRAHNIEHDYYRSLANYEGGRITKAYYLKEARALEKFEKILSHSDGVFPISIKDTEYFSNLGLKSNYLPAFYHKLRRLESFKQSVEKVVLYQGNLQVEENVEAVLFLLGVFKELPYQLIIAGNNPSDVIGHAVTGMKNVTLVQNPDDEEMFKLIQTSKLNCLPTFQSTGIKLKLLHALTSGNEVLVNPEMVNGTGLAEFCTLAKGKVDWSIRIAELMEGESDQKVLQKRRNDVSELFDNQINAKQLAEWLGLVR